VLDAGYLPKIPNCTQSQEVSILSSFWEPIGACGLHTRTDGRPYEDRGDIELGSVEECETAQHYSGTYEILHKFYQKVCPDMEKLLNKDVTFYSNDDCKKILDILKEKMVTVLILVFPDWKKDFHVHVDVSCIALGAVLTQEGEEGLDHPIVFRRHRLYKEEMKYSTTKC